MQLAAGLQFSGADIKLLRCRAPIQAAGAKHLRRFRLQRFAFKLIELVVGRADTAVELHGRSHLGHARSHLLIQQIGCGGLLFRGFADCDRRRPGKHRLVQLRPEDSDQMIVLGQCPVHVDPLRAAGGRGQIFDPHAVLFRGHGVKVLSRVGVQRQKRAAVELGGDIDRRSVRGDVLCDDGNLRRHRFPLNSNGVAVGIIGSVFVLVKAIQVSLHRVAAGELPGRDGKGIGAGAGIALRTDSVTAVRVTIGSGCAAGQVQGAVLIGIVPGHLYGHGVGVYGKAALLNNHGVRLLLTRNGEITGFKVVQLFIVPVLHRDPQDIPGGQGVSWDRERANAVGEVRFPHCGKRRIIVGDPPVDGLEEIDCVDLLGGISSRYRKGQARTLRRQRTVGGHGEQRRALGFDSDCRGLRQQLAVFQQKGHDLFPGSRRLGEGHGAVPRRHIGAGGKPITCLRSEGRGLCIVLLHQQERAFRHRPAQRIDRRSVALGDAAALDGNGRLLLLRRAGDQHGIIGLTELALIVVAGGKVQLHILRPVDHGTHPIARFQRIVGECDLFPGKGIGHRKRPQHGDLIRSVKIEALVCRILPHGNADSGLSFLCRLEQTRIAGKGDVQGGRPGLQFLFIDRCIRVGIVPEALTILVYDLRGLGGVDVAIPIIPIDADVQAGDDPVAHRHLGKVD